MANQEAIGRMQVPGLPKRVLIGLQDGYCNLSCPSCFVHGNNNKASNPYLRGQMSLKNANRIFDEIAHTGIFISPVLWSEPLLIKEFEEYVRSTQNYGLNLFINTNGLLFDR